jgi:LysR family transcriptional regulator, low CO2-responsive transcriptional regulator
VGADGPHHVMPVVAQFSGAFPDVDVSLQMGNAQTVMQRLLEARLDVAILGRRIEDPRYHFTALRSSPLVCIVNTAHHWARRKSVSLAEIATHKLILREPGSETRRMFELGLKERHIALGDILVIESCEAVREAVAAGLGVGVVSYAELNVDQRLKALHTRDTELMLTEFVACLSERQRSSVVQAFFDAAQIVSRTDPHGDWQRS